MPFPLAISRNRRYVRQGKVDWEHGVSEMCGVQQDSLIICFLEADQAGKTEFQFVEQSHLQEWPDICECCSSTRSNGDLRVEIGVST